MRLDPSRAIGAYAAVTTLALAWVALTSAAGPTRFTTIDAERINIREPDGTLRLVITDAAHQPGIVLGKRVIPHPGRTDAGMLFYNREGIENGGLIFDGAKDNGRTTNGGSLTFDRYRQDQTVQMVSEEDGSVRTAGFRVIDRPDGPLDVDAAVAAQATPPGPARDTRLRAANAYAMPRAFLGREADGAAMLQLRDGAGRVRIRLIAPPAGEPRIELLDAAGRVTRTMAGG
jgi:hypothetical protein